MRTTRFARVVAAGFAAVCWHSVSAQTIKIGLINTYSGPNAAQGDQIDKGVKLYMKLNADKLPPGVKVELITRDDTGPNPEAARRDAQELIVQEKVQFLTGVVWTPCAAAIAPLSAEAKVPFISMNAAGANLPYMSPYFARVSHTIGQSAYTLGEWAGKTYKRAYVAVSDFTPGYEAEEFFIRGFTSAGGDILGKVHIPLANPDYVPYMQRVKDAKPDVLFAFAPAGKHATAMMKAYGDLGMRNAGVKYIGTGDITTDEELQNMGDVALGVTTVFHYSAAGDRPANKAFVAAYKKEYGENLQPGFMVVGAWDGMDLIYTAIRKQGGKVDPDKTMDILRNYSSATSPRGSFSMYPDTRDVINPEYLREVRKVGNTYQNVELETLSATVAPRWWVR